MSFNLSFLDESGKSRYLGNSGFLSCHYHWECYSFSHVCRCDCDAVNWGTEHRIYLVREVDDLSCDFNLTNWLRSLRVLHAHTCIHTHSSFNGFRGIKQFNSPGTSYKIDKQIQCCFPFQVLVPKKLYVQGFHGSRERNFHSCESEQSLSYGPNRVWSAGHSSRITKTQLKT